MGLKNSIIEYFPKTVDEHQCKDSGMALVLICLLIAFLGEKYFFVPLAIFFLILNMIVPAVYRKFAKVWLGISQIIGTVVSKIILTIIFVFMVIPIGVLRRWLGKDPLQMRYWKKGPTSVFTVRDHRFNSNEIEKPY